VGRFCLAQMRRWTKRPGSTSTRSVRRTSEANADGGPEAQRRDEAKPSNPSVSAITRLRRSECKAGLPLAFALSRGPRDRQA
jgi:hypothetical protein